VELGGQQAGIVKLQIKLGDVFEDRGVVAEMKIGSESRGKLIAAIVLMVLAVVLVGQWLSVPAGRPRKLPRPSRQRMRWPWRIQLRLHRRPRER